MQARFWLTIGLSMAVNAILLLAPPDGGAALAASFTVNTAGDVGDIHHDDGICDSSDDPGEQCTLRAAVDQADVLGGASTITLPPGSYPGNNLGFGVALTIVGGGEASTIINGSLTAGGTGGSLRMSDVTVVGQPGAWCIAGRLTLTRVTATDCGDDGIRLVGGSELSQVTVKNAGDDGISATFPGQVTISDTTVDGAGAAGISIAGPATLTNVSVTNTFNGLVVVDGGTLSNVTVKNSPGGGLGVGNSTVNGATSSNNAFGVSAMASTLNSVTITDNAGMGLALSGVSGKTTQVSGGTVARNNGGGVAVGGNGPVTISGTSINSNRRNAIGAGLENSNTALTLQDVSITGNLSTSGVGGGLHNDPGAVLIMNGGTVSGNTAPDAGGLFFRDSYATLTGVTVSQNTATNATGTGGVGLTLANAGKSPTPVTFIQGSISNNTGDGYNLATGNARLEGVTVQANSRTGLVTSGPTSKLTVVGGAVRGNAFSGIQVSRGELIMTDTTIADNTNGDSSSGGGGVSIAPSGKATMLRVTISGNRAAIGGGILTGGITNLNTMTITGNTATGPSAHGGGIASVGANAILDAVTISNNTASGENAQGGGIHNTGAGQIELGNVTITGNQVTGGGADAQGGGIANSTGTVTMSGGGVRGNSAPAHGGIANLFQGSGTSSRITLTEVAIDGNQAASGAGGMQNGGVATLNRVAITGNTSPIAAYINGRGGNQSTPAAVRSSLTNVTISSNAGGSAGIGHTGGAVDLLNVTIAANQDGIIASTAGVSAKNTLIANNTGKNCTGAIATQGNNLDSDNSCGLTGPGDLPAKPAQIGPLANNGGPTQTHALLASSPALDGGTNTGCPSMDQRGQPRPQGARCDIGAFEASGSAPPPTASCEQRPPVSLQTAPTGDGRLRVTITSTTSPSLQTNALKSLTFTRLDNAVVEVGSQQVSAPGNVSLAGSPQSTTIVVRRPTPGQPTTVQLQVVDGCSTPWPTFVGGGPAAF
ncbi:MAG: choice-of-anchor Q domain-containing protein [Chloroflexota bacterium]